MSLHIALPSKGRLRDKALGVFEKSGLRIAADEEARTYKASMENMKNVEVHFLSAREIAREIALGSIQLGITGIDLAHENEVEKDESAIALGFGKADVVVAVPNPWVDVETMADLDDVAASYRNKVGRRMRVATKYRILTQQHFQKFGIGIYRLVDSLGATEGAPASGQADVIVDITSSGDTLKANNLKTLKDGLILTSQAYLIQSQKMDKTQSEMVKTIKKAIQQSI